MFITKVGNSIDVWHNGKGDDFLRFLPEKFEVDPAQIDLYWIVKADHNKIKRIPRGCEISIANGKASIGIRPGEGLPLEPVCEASLISIEAWPYDEAGNFLGFAEIP
jgi:hypothetical protein